MTSHQVKKSVAALLQSKNIPFTKLTTTKLGFTDLARDEVYRVAIHGADITFDQLNELKAMAGKPSECGYMLRLA
jgi:hypothetical protein